MNQSSQQVAQPKYTRGEQCILTHLVLTIGVIIVLLIIYLIHISVVDHSGLTSVIDTRRAVLPIDKGLNKFPVGSLCISKIPIQNICNTLLLSQEWSVSAGHCVAMRSDPDLSYLLYDWKVKYPYDVEGSKIIRSIVHPHFNRDTFADNIGVVKHNPLSEIQRYKIPKINGDNYYYGVMERKNLALISWNHGYEGEKHKISVHNVKLMTTGNCTSYVTSIIELRTYECCFILKTNMNRILEHGSIIIETKDFTALGIFTWGERQQKSLPLIVLNLSHFKEWINNVVLFTQ